MGTIFVLALMCYVYFVLIWGLITYTVIHEGTSLSMLFGAPALITLADLQGEVHGHTTWSDGAASVAEMAEAARQRGYRYWSVSDHSIGLGVVQGVDGAQLRQQAEEIAAVNARYAEQGVDFRLFQGTEVEILGERRPAALQATPLFDANASRMRS